MCGGEGGTGRTYEHKVRTFDDESFLAARLLQPVSLFCYHHKLGPLVRLSDAQRRW